MTKLRSHSHEWILQIQVHLHAECLVTDLTLISYGEFYVGEYINGERKREKLRATGRERKEGTKRIKRKCTALKSRSSCRSIGKCTKSL